MSDRAPAPGSRIVRRIAVALGALVALAVLLVKPVVSAVVPPPPGKRIVLWHSQRGAERAVLEDLLRKFNEAHAGSIVVEPLAVPDTTFKDKVRRAIPHGAGPDLFIRPHNEIGALEAAGVVSPLTAADLPSPEARYIPGLIAGVSSHSAILGVPLTYKSLVAFYNTRLLDAPLGSIDDLPRLRTTLPDDTYPLAYDATSLFFHSPLFLGAHGHAIDDEGKFRLFEGDARASFDLPGTWRKARILPPDVSYNEAVRLFESEKSAVFFCGPWYRPGGEIGRSDHWAVAPLPRIGGEAGGSFVTVESAFVSTSTHDRAAALEVARWLGSRQAQEERFSTLDLAPVDQEVYAELDRLPSRDARGRMLAEAQRSALEHGAVTPSSERMNAVWNPALDVLSASAAGRDVNLAVEQATYTLSRVADDRPAEANGTLYGALLVALLLVGTLLVVRRVRLDVSSPAAARDRLRGAFGRVAVPYVLPGIVAVGALVLVPVVVSIGMSLFEYRAGHFAFVGLTNFKEILLPPMARAFEARSFYFALLVTVLWTLVNITLHVTLGVGLALLLRPSYVKFRTAYRLVLVLPWAIPNYITALMWKGMFHAQVGAINHLLKPFGFEGYNWFDRFGTAFFANVVTNTWLGFPFMMIVTLGALTSIPGEIEEAAILDGASRWLRFKTIVFPHIRPALLPSILLGSVWTFNMFNVVYLVSGGEPGSQTDILVSEAYRWAFERGERYGYAAAYSVLIFVFLLFYGRLTRRLDTKEAT